MVRLARLALAVVLVVASASPAHAGLISAVTTTLTDDPLAVPYSFTRVGDVLLIGGSLGDPDGLPDRAAIWSYNLSTGATTQSLYWNGAIRSIAAGPDGSGYVGGDFLRPDGYTNGVIAPLSKPNPSGYSTHAGCSLMSRWPGASAGSGAAKGGRLGASRLSQTVQIPGSNEVSLGPSPLTTIGRFPGKHPPPHPSRHLIRWHPPRVRPPAPSWPAGFPDASSVVQPGPDHFLSPTAAARSWGSPPRSSWRLLRELCYLRRNQNLCGCDGGEQSRQPGCRQPGPLRCG
jgi:hypothetical protein